MSSYQSSESREDFAGHISCCLDQILLKVNVFFPIRDSVSWQKQNLIPASLMGQISHLFVKATGLCSEDLAGRRIALILIKLWRRKEKKSIIWFCYYWSACICCPWSILDFALNLHANIWFRISSKLEMVTCCGGNAMNRYICLGEGKLHS